MAGFQFVHIECYSHEVSALKGRRMPKKGSANTAGKSVKQREWPTDGHHEGKGWTARKVLAEALREEGNHPHVTHPKPPELLLGDIDQLAARLDEFTPPKGQRKDATIMLGGVVSAPWPPGDPRSVEWRMDTLNWLKQEFKDNLAAVVGHGDERWDHLHFYVATPDLKPVKAMHPGWAAKAQCKGDTKEKNEAYTAAMRGFQDRYSEEVGLDHGMARLGPQRRRLTRGQWQAEQAQAEAAEKASVKAKKIMDKALEESEIIRTEAAKKVTGFNQKVLDFRAEKSTFEDRKSKIVRAAEQIFDMLPASIQSKFAEVFQPLIEPDTKTAPAKPPGTASEAAFGALGTLRTMVAEKTAPAPSGAPSIKKP